MTAGLISFLRDKPGVSHIFVDVFDTLLLRNTTPEIQRYWQIAGHYHDTLRHKGVTPLPSRDTLFLARVQAWRTAYITTPIIDGCREADFDTILRLTCLGAGLEEALAPALRQAELMYETTALSSNHPLVHDLLKLQQEGKTIFYVSDMYFSADDIRILLSKHIPNGLITHGYVSAESGLSKRAQGRLFQHIMDKERLCPNQIVHLGDNRHSDYIVPRSLGLHAIYTPRHPAWRLLQSARTRIFLLYLQVRNMEEAP